MKLVTLILITAILHVSASTFAQKITLSEKNAPLVQVFNQISDQTGYDFIFSATTLKDAKPVNIVANNEELNEVLKRIFAGQPLDFAVAENSIVVTQRSSTPLEKIKVAATPMDVIGRVVDEQGQPLISATVQVKNGKQQVTITDEKGYFTLKGVETNAVIVITVIGFDRKEIPASSNMGDIRLTVATSKLDEVQVIAYGTTTKRLSTGDVSTVSAKDIAKQPVDNPLLALQGRVPGLLITQATGLAGSGIRVNIRGENSIGGGTAPLFIIDGVPYPEQSFPMGPGLDLLGDKGLGSYAGSGNSFSHINPADIESISVLKDADATSIYGSQGAISIPFFRRIFIASCGVTLLNLLSIL